MTEEQFQELRKMTKRQIIKKYLPLLTKNKIKRPEYDKLLSYATDNDDPPPARADTPEAMAEMFGGKVVDDESATRDGGNACPTITSSGATSHENVDALPGPLRQESAEKKSVDSQRDGARTSSQARIEPRPEKPDVASEDHRPQKELLLELLLDGEWHDTPEIQRKVYGANHLGSAAIPSRVSELRKEGFVIVSEKKAGSIWHYRLGP